MVTFFSLIASIVESMAANPVGAVISMVLNWNKASIGCLRVCIPREHETSHDQNNDLLIPDQRASLS